MRIGFIGAGSMGRHMAANLLAAGHELVVYDAREQVRDDSVLQGAGWVGSAAELSRGAECVITALPGPPEVRELALAGDGIVPNLDSGALYIDMSTSTPDLAREIAAAAERRVAVAVDAPVSGGPRGARKATLSIMVGASDAGYEAALPVLRCLGEQVFHVGGAGAGQVAKLVNNMMGLTNGIAAMEAMVVGTRAGVDPRRLLEVVMASAGNSFVLNMVPYIIFKRAFDPPKFALSLAAKDLRLAVEFAEGLGVPLRVVSDACAALADAEEHGLGGLDWSSYITLLEQQAGVEVRG
ncbi:MAG: NAD-binding protein [Micromonosporaceae bacterium]|nr:NAD-binding protein [Micromonosporaceae bacterium]